jgi:hypothetical protein
MSSHTLRKGALDYLTIKFEHKAQYTVGRRVLGPKLIVKLRIAASVIPTSCQLWPL